MFGRLNSQPFIGGPLNFFGEANYTYNRAIIEKGFTLRMATWTSLSGNQVPEVPFHIAAMTLGIENYSGWRWDASVDLHLPRLVLHGCRQHALRRRPEREDGMVPEVWLLSARFNLDIGNTGASVFVAGDNLTNELYITDREDGLKPGMGRTVWTGFKYKF